MVSGKKNLEAEYVKSEQRGMIPGDGKQAGHKRLRLRTVSTVLVIGMLVGTVSIREIFRYKRIWIVAALRLLFCPLLAMIVRPLRRFCTAIPAVR